jgi:hypothetical protein
MSIVVLVFQSIINREVLQDHYLFFLLLNERQKLSSSIHIITTPIICLLPYQNLCLFFFRQNVFINPLSFKFVTDWFLKFFK